MKIIKFTSGIIASVLLISLITCKKETEKTEFKKCMTCDSQKKDKNSETKSENQRIPAYCSDLTNPCADPACALYYNCDSSQSNQDILIEIKNTLDYKNYVRVFQDSLGELDFSKATYTNLDSGSYVTIPSLKKVNGSNISKGVFQFSYDNTSLGIGIIYNYAGAIVNNNQFLYGNYKISFPNGWELCIIEKYQNGNYHVSDGRDIDAIDDYIAGRNQTARVAIGTPCYYGFVRNCYTTSKTACDNDPNCSFYCDFLPCNSLRLMDCALKGLRYCKIFRNARNCKKN